MSNDELSKQSTFLLPAEHFHLSATAVTQCVPKGPDAAGLGCHPALWAGWDGTGTGWEAVIMETLIPPRPATGFISSVAPSSSTFVCGTGCGRIRLG